MNRGIEAAVEAAVEVDASAGLSLAVRGEPSAAKVYEIDPLCDPRWEVFVNAHSQASVFHSTNWLRALQIGYGYEPVVVTTSPRETALTNGLVFCRVNSWLTGRRLVSLPFSDHCEPLASNSAHMEDLLFHMRQLIDAGKWEYIEIRPVFYQPSPQTELHKTSTYRFHSLDLRKGKQALFNSFHKNCVQRKIRRAEREQLHYEEGISDNLLRKFYALQVETRQRHYLPPQPLSWFRALIKAFGGDLKIRVASKGDLPIASIVTLAHKKSMVYKYGCSDVRFHNLGAMTLLFWNAIQEAKDKWIEQLEMGRSNSDNPGLISFKEHWGAVGKPLNYWTYPPRHGAALTVWEKAVLRRLIPFTPKSALKMAGNLLYRHIG
jgi:hypothetical protein